MYIIKLYLQKFIMDILFIIGLILIFVGFFLILLSTLLSTKKAKTESGYVIVVWPFFVAGGDEKIVPILLTLAIILSAILLAFLFVR